MDNVCHFLTSTASVPIMFYMAFIDLTGRTVGRWTVVSRTEQKKKVRFNCRCRCGTERTISSSDLRSGRTNSCGCLQKERAGIGLRSVHRKTYHSWMGMRQRCYYAGHVEYHRYGARGIVMAQTWRDSFEAFLSDMGPKPEGHSIDRIDLNGPYSKDNCRWATRDEQMSNTSKNVFVEHEGERLTLKQLANKIGVNYYRLHAQYRRRGLSLAEAIAKCERPGINRPYRWKPSNIGTTSIPPGRAA